MHPVFGVVADILHSGEPQSQDWKLQAELVVVMPNGFEVENHRRDDINIILQKYISHPVGLGRGIRGIAGTKDSDGSSGDKVIFFNVEYKNEKSKGDSYPYMQNAGFYVHYWAKNKVASHSSTVARGSCLRYWGKKWACPL